MAIKPLTLVNGTLADANQVMQLFDELYSNIDSSNVAAANKTGTGKFVLDGGTPTFSGNVTFNGTSLFSTATANANRFHGAGDGYGGASTVLTISSDALASSNFNYLKCVADYNGTPTTVFTVGAGGSTSILTGSELFLGASSWRESVANVLTAKISGSDRLSISTTQLVLGTTLDAVLQPTKKFYLDGGGDTFIDEVSANVTRFVSGNTEFMRSNASGEVLFPNVDPPTANYANRNGIVKGWIKATTGPGAGVISVIDSYNVSSATETGSGATLRINWNTDFANANYTFQATALANDGGGNFYSGPLSVVNQTSALLELLVASNDGTADGNPTNAAQWWVMAIGDQ